MIRYTFEETFGDDLMVDDVGIIFLETLEDHIVESLLIGCTDGQVLSCLNSYG